MNKTRKILISIGSLILFLMLGGPAWAADADGDGIPDVSDPDTIYGTISGDVQEGVILNIETYSCGVGELVATITTNAEGYYAVGGLENDSYGIVPQHSNYIFSPGTVVLQIPQTEIRSYDFTATLDLCTTVDRFLDNADGTVTDCGTGLIWLKNANCYGIQSWDNATAKMAGLNSGECGLSDGSTEGDWRRPTTFDLQGIGTDPPTVWETGYPTVPWTMPSLPFTNVQSTSSYWSTTPPWGVRMDGYTFEPSFFGYLYVWPVRDPN
jgi:hypothetical protein